MRISIYFAGHKSALSLKNYDPTPTLDARADVAYALQNRRLPKKRKLDEVAPEPCSSSNIQGPPPPSPPSKRQALASIENTMELDVGLDFLETVDCTGMEHLVKPVPVPSKIKIIAAKKASNEKEQIEVRSETEENEVSSENEHVEVLREISVPVKEIVEAQPPSVKSPMQNSNNVPPQIASNQVTAMPTTHQGFANQVVGIANTSFGLLRQNVGSEPSQMWNILMRSQDLSMMQMQLEKMRLDLLHKARQT